MPATRESSDEQFLDVELDEEDEDTAIESDNGKAPRKDNPLLRASKVAMEQLLVLDVTPRQLGDGDRAQELLKSVIMGRLSPAISAAVKTAIAYDIDAAFRIARQDWR